MLPMRSIPFKVVCLLGLNDGRFPKTDHRSTFDLMNREFRPGDRSARDDDRYQFLEAVLAARSTLYLSYIGQSIRSNENIPPSVIVAEFLDILSALYGVEDAVTEHPLHPFNKKYFIKSKESRLFSYNQYYCKTAENLQNGQLSLEPWWRGKLEADIEQIDFDDLLGFLTGAVDAVIAAQTIALAAESVGLGICYMGTTWWAADQLIKLFALPEGVFPVTSLVLGHPAEAPTLRDRLPLEIVVHRKQYQALSDEQIVATHADRERTAWARYNATESVRQRLAEAGITRVTDYYTSEMKYGKGRHQQVSEMLIKTLQAQGLWL